MRMSIEKQPKISLGEKVGLIIGGLFLALIIVEIGLRAGGAIILSLQEQRNRISLRQKDTYRVLCLGESTTMGEYPVYLEEFLNKRNIGIKFSVIDKGIAGIFTSGILTHLESNLDNYHPDMVIVMMGINDREINAFYEANSTSKINLFFSPFKVYKLARFLWLHIISVAKEMNSAKSAELVLKDSNAYSALGLICKNQGKFSQAEDLFKNAIASNPKDFDAYIGLGYVYQKQGKFSKAEDAFKKAIEFNPRDSNAHSGLGYVYKYQRKLTQAEELFKKAIELNPKNYNAYIELGWVYQKQGKLFQDEDAFRKAIELNPEFDKAYIELGWVYQKQGKFSQAEELLRKAIELNPKNEQANGLLAILYSETGKSDFAQIYSRKAQELLPSYYNLITVTNYHKLKEVLDKKRVKLVYVQYPMRNIEPLKTIFESPNDIIFVDNAKIFRDAVKKSSYKDYFRDMFGGDFGHCTPKGNRLLAENIGGIIMKECFNK